ncbi:MAG: hypothetical protein BWY77_01951 [bacterium ADurb.Bin431]|nr:MAG: hypothetical protein BWY77_01951 [bacterium ADurb.Bin431]
MFDADELIAKLARLPACGLEEIAGGAAVVELSGAADLGKSGQRLLRPSCKQIRIGAYLPEQGAAKSLRLVEEREQEVNRLDLLVTVIAGQLLAAPQGLLGLDRQFIHRYHFITPCFRNLYRAEAQRFRRY